MYFSFQVSVLFVPLLSCASPARGDAPSPSAGRVRSVQPRTTGAGLEAAGAGPAESEWVGSRLEVWERVVTVAPGDGGRPLAPGELAPLCLRRHGYSTKGDNVFNIDIRKQKKMFYLQQLS